MMAAQVEVQAGEVGRTGVGGRLHLSPLTDSSNKSLIDIPSINQSHIITPEPNKPLPGPKPRLSPKPFSVEKNPTIKPILAPKPQTKPRPDPSRLSGPKPEPPFSPKPQQADATGKPRPESTNPNRPTSTTTKSSNKLSIGQTTKPVIHPFKAASPLIPGDPTKPVAPVPALRQRPPAQGLAYTKTFKKLPAAEWSGSTKKEDEKDQISSSKSGTSISRAKSMGSLDMLGQEEEEKKKPKPEVGVPLRPQARGSRQRPVSAIFLDSPTKTEPPIPSPRWSERRPLSADLTSKFESIGLSLHRKTPKPNTKENTPEEKPLPKRNDTDKPVKIVTPQSTDNVATPTVPDQSNKLTEDVRVKETAEDQGAVSIKKRISLLLDSSSPGAGVIGQGTDLHSLVQPIPETEPAVGVKQLIKQLTEDTTPAQSPVLKPPLKPRPLPLDLTKRFTPERSPDLNSVSHSEATDCHDIDKDPQKRTEDSSLTPSDQNLFVDLKDPQELLKKTTTEEPELGEMLSTTSKENDPSGGIQTVRASLFENIVERHSVLMMDEVKPMARSKDSHGSPLLRRESSDEGTLVTATYKEPVSPSSPLRVLHSFDTLQAAEESKAVSESLPSAHREDKAMTLRSRRSEGSRPVAERNTEPVMVPNAEQQPRYLRVGALPKWTTAGLEPEPSKETQVKGYMDTDREGQRDSEQEEVAAAPKRLKMLQADEQPKPKATYFALTGQIQEPVSPSSMDTTVHFEDLSVRSAMGSSQGKILPIKRNQSLEEAFGKSSQDQVDESILRSALEGNAGGIMEVEKKRQLIQEAERHKAKMKALEWEKRKQLEIEKEQSEFERMKEREKQREFERQRQKAYEREQKEFEEKQRQERQKQQQLERERQEGERQRQLEKERRRALERQRQKEFEEQEKERHREQERQRQREEERQRKLDRERQLLELQKERKEMEELEREQRQKQREMERQQVIEIEKKRLQEKMLREEAEKNRKEKQMALEQEMFRLRELDKERERKREMEIEQQRETEREKQRKLERQRQREMERERQKQLDIEREELEIQRLRQQELEKERKMKEEMERIMEVERRQLLEFERQNQVEMEKRRLREKIENEEAEKMRQIAKQQEAERQRLKEKQKKDEQERARLEASTLRPTVVDLDSVIRNEPFSKASPQRSDLSTRWKEPSPRSDESYKPAILDIDSFTSQVEPFPSKDLFHVSGIQGVDTGYGTRLQPTPERDVSWKVPAQSSVGISSPVWTMSPQDPWELRPVEVSVDKPTADPTKAANKKSPEQLLLRMQEERVPVPQRNWSVVPNEPFHLDPFLGSETKTGGSFDVDSSSLTTEQLWVPREPQPPESSIEGRSHRRSTGVQELNRMRSRSMSRRSAPSSSAVEGSLSRMRSRSAHRQQDRYNWEQQKQRVGADEEGKESETPVCDTDSQYGTWETGLRTDDSLTPATPSSESNLSPSPKKPTPPDTPGDPSSLFDTDTVDSLLPSSSSENQPLPFPDAPTVLLDTSALRSRAQLGKKRAPRSRPSRAALQSAVQTDDWLYRDSTEAKIEVKENDSDSEEPTRGADVSSAATSQPQRIALFPGMDPLALKAQLKKRGDADNQTDVPAPSPPQVSRSPKSPFLPRAARVLPPSGGKENGEEDSPQWLKELKSKKRLSQYENDS